ncbi:glycoside hydrolase family 43 protein [Halalkalibacter urbisdiaboli]|uniref:glycoside hydrolase family 43 protein n=1 Tax=Halalkalibacter urbisdiaboli TaxID=1960589 RepID=UPI000B45012C|nr:glycoside hydrolase family 43 protein [Halalkalibacter urbisdiaboli]
MLKNEEIRIRDPFVLPIKDEQTYYLYGTTDDNVWEGKGTGFDVYKSHDLKNWEGPFPAFRPSVDFWAEHHFWAPEVYEYAGRYYMFATFKAETQCRGTQVLMSEHPIGPFQPLTEQPITPREWECLDGTLFIDENEKPWMIFCHEWLQVQDGKICAMPLSLDLREAIGEPVVLFSASEAAWTRGEGRYVTDGPYLYRNKQGQLQMLWSSQGDNGYAIGVARSTSGSILGPWTHDSTPLFGESGGHGMLFQTFSGEQLLTIHTPNQSPKERPAFFEVKEEDGTLMLGERLE